MLVQTRGTLLEDGHFEGILHDLVSRRDTDGVLSVYLDIDPATAAREDYEAALLDALKPVLARQQDLWNRGRLEHEVEGVLDAVRSWRQAPGRSVAMFFSGPCGLAIVIPLRFPIRSVARFESRAVLGPLIAALEEHRRYAVVLFDKARARIITVLLGEVEEEVEIESDVLGRSAVGGFGGYLQSRYERHRETQLHAHARRTVEHLWAIDRSRPLHTLMISGPPEAVAALHAVLPKALERIAVPAGDVTLNTITPDVVHRVEGVDRAVREEEDRGFVAGLISETRACGRAVLGWPDTLAAVTDGRVHRLAVIRGVTRAGVECEQCGCLGAEISQRCPRCEASVAPVPDIVEVAVRHALLADSHVHYLSPGSGAALGRYGIGALLRY